MVAPKSLVKEIICLAVLPLLITVGSFLFSDRPSEKPETESTKVSTEYSKAAITALETQCDIALPDEPCTEPAVSAGRNDAPETTTRPPETTVCPIETNRLSTDDENDMIRKTPEDIACENYVADWTCDANFYDRYFADYETMSAANNLDNVLIVMTKDMPDDHFGASFMVTAPEYTYFLQYTDEAERENAYAYLQALEEEGKVFSVSKNYRAVRV